MQLFEIDDVAVLWVFIIISPFVSFLCNITTFNTLDNHFERDSYEVRDVIFCVS